MAGTKGSGSGKAGKELKGMARSLATELKKTKINPAKSVGIKLFLIIFVSIVVCVLTVGLLAYSEAKKMIENNVSNASFQTVKQVTNNLDVVFQNYSDLSMQITIDRDLRAQLATHDQAEDMFSNMQASRAVTDRLNNYIMSNNMISGTVIIPLKEGGQTITAGVVDSQVISAARESDWMRQTLENEGRIHWVQPQPEGTIISRQANTFALARMIRNIDGALNNYVLVLEMSLEGLAERFADVQLGEGSDLSIIDSDGMYILNKDYSKLNTPYVASLPTEGEAARFGGGKLVTTNGDEVLSVYETLKLSEWKLVGTIPVQQLVEDAKVIQGLTWTMVAFAAILALAIGIVVVFAIARPLVVLRNLMVEGAGGNLTVRSTLRKRSDEIGELAVSFNDMMSKIADLAKQTTHSAAQVLATANDLTDASKKTAISAKEISVATEEIANGATSLAVEAEKGNDLTNQMNNQMQMVMEANQQMSLSAVEVEQASEQGTAYMGQLIDKTGRTEEMTRSMVEKVEALKDSTGSIVKILDVLNNLTKQTNILSLNATIEAARAGAAGKGFMVVADEIRKLADQSRQSIDIVGQITAKIGTEIEETVHVLSDAYPLFQEQIVSVKEANTIFMTVQGQMGQFVQKLEQATSSIGQLNQSQSILSDAMTNVSAVAEESSATSEEVASLSSEQLGISENLVNLSNKLDSVSQGLKVSLSKFRIE